MLPRHVGIILHHYKDACKQTSIIYGNMVESKAKVLKVAQLSSFEENLWHLEDYPSQ